MSTLEGSTWGEAVRTFLEAHPNETFTVDEIAGKVGAHKGTASACLYHLALHRVECRRLPGTKYRWVPDHRLDDAEAALQLAQEQLAALLSLVGEQLAVLASRRHGGGHHS